MSKIFVTESVIYYICENHIRWFQYIMYKVSCMQFMDRTMKTAFNDIYFFSLNLFASLNISIYIQDTNKKNYFINIVNHNEHTDQVNGT